MREIGVSSPNSSSRMSDKAKKLINDSNVVVTEFIEGLVETYPGLQYLDGFPKIKVVFRADVYGKTYDKVAVISGGGSGHEPAHAGFVGEGMLTAAICGDVFTSPLVDSILAGIRAVTGPMGCLLIVMNYTDERLNFGLAAEEAKSEGYKVETVVVGDDCALPPPRGVAGRRGLAGTILVHKVAGAAAAAGLSLAEVAAEAKHASERVRTMSVALSVCTLPGEVPSDRLGPRRMKLCLVIHGEPGAVNAEIWPFDVVVSHVLSQILSLETQYVPITRGSRVVLMINGLDATPLMVLMLAAGKAVPQLQLEHGLAVDRVYTGSFMTFLDTAGFSISIMKADPSILLRLDAPTKAPSWPVGAEGDRQPAKIPVPVPPSRLKTNEEAYSQPQELNEHGSILECVIEAAANEIINVQEKLIEVGDVDCGSTVNPPPCLRPQPCLPEDITVEILSKLPVRSLLRFRSVSKSWNRLISTSYKRLPLAMSGFFFQDYVTLNIKFISLQSRTYIDASSIDAGLTFLPRSDLIISNCCNGLLLLTTPHRESLYVCNPATKKWAHIPGPTTKSKYFKLVFEPIHSKNYTIICFPFVEDGGDNFFDEVDVMLEVFSSHTCQWRKTYSFNFSKRGDNYMDDHDFVFHNGLLYFVELGDIYAINTEGRLCLRIKGLDYGDLFPIGICPSKLCDLDMWDSMLDSVCLGQSGGLLHNVLFTGKPPNSELLVWVLKDSHSIEYILKHRNRKMNIRQKMGRCSGKMQFQFIHPDLDVLFFKIQDNFLSQQKIFSYQMPNGEVEEICNTDGYGGFIGYTPCFREDLNLQATPSSSVCATPLAAASPIPLVQPSAIALSPTATSSPSSVVIAAHFASDTEGVGELAGHNQDTDSFKERLKKLVAMGFEKTQAEVALTAADGDPNVAIEILMNQQR